MGIIKKKMFKSAFLALGLIANTASAASTCKMTIETFSDDSCETVKEVLPLYEDGVATLTFTFGKCLSVTGSSDSSYLKVALCDADKFVAISRFEDANCMNYETPAVTGFVPDDCSLHDDSTWIRVTDVELSGNKYGIGYLDAWSIFICQTVLFGVCAGYD